MHECGKSYGAFCLSKYKNCPNCRKKIKKLKPNIDLRDMAED